MKVDSDLCKGLVARNNCVWVVMEFFWGYAEGSWVSLISRLRLKLFAQITITKITSSSLPKLSSLCYGMINKRCNYLRNSLYKQLSEARQYVLVPSQ